MKKPEQGMTLIVKTITRFTVGLILLFGIYIVLHGHLTPGGGFAGGVIIALSFVHLMLAFGREVALKKINENTSELIESIGAVMFLTIAVLGFISGSFFFLNIFGKGTPFHLFSAGNILLYNIAISLKVGAGLFAIFIVLVFFKVPNKPEG